MPPDVLEVVAHLERRSVSIADRFVNNLATTLDWLAENAESGSLKSYPSLPLTDLRTWSVDGFRTYLIVYRIEADSIVVFGVLNGHRDLPTLLRFRM